MSMYCVIIFKEPAPAQGTWTELLDSLNEAALFLRAHEPREFTAFEIGDDDRPTGIVLRYELNQAAFIADDARPARTVPEDE